MTTNVFKAQVALPTQTPQYPKGEGYGALINDQWVRLAPDKEVPVRFYTRDSLAQRSDDSGSIYQNVLDIGYSFGRSDLSGGEGLDWSPRIISQQGQTEILDETKFWDSKNIDTRRPVRGEFYSLQLAKATELWRNYTALVDIATTDEHLYVADGTTVERWSDWTDLVPDESYTVSDTVRLLDASPADDVAAVLVDGTIEIYTPVTNVFTAVPGIAGAQASWFVKGRFVAEIDNGDGTRSLIEYDEVGASPFGPFDTYKGNCMSVVSSGPAIVAAIDDGTLRSYVPEQANQNDPTSVNLVIRGRTETPEGEVPILLGANAGVLLVMTRTTNEAGATNARRLYQAEVLNYQFDYTVGQLQLVREWEAAYGQRNELDNMATTRDEIWFMVQETSTEEFMWRFDLVTNGLTRHSQVDVEPAHSLVIFDEVAGFVHNNDIHIWDADEYVDSGYLITPNITFGLNTDISWLALVGVVSNLAGSGQQVELFYSTEPEAILDPDHASWRLGYRVSSPGNEEPDVPLAKVKSRTLALKLVLYSSEAGFRTPRVQRFAVRGIPTQRDFILELPVNVSDTVSAPGRMPYVIPTLGDEIHRSMLSLAGESVEIQVLDPPFGFRGIIDNVIEPTEYISDRGSASVRCILQCRGTRVTATAVPTGDSGLGLGLLGVSTLGIGQTIRT